MYTRLKLKRLLALLLSVLMLLNVPLTAMADTPGGSQGANISTSYPGGNGASNGTGANAPIYRDYGFRITVSDSKQLQGVVTTLSGNYTREQLASQRADVESYLSHVYYEPGDDGIYFWARKNRNINPSLGIVSSYPSDGMNIRGFRLAMPDDPTSVSVDDNALAWMCYEGVSGGTRMNSIQYVPEMGEAIKNAASTYGNGDDFLYHLKTLYIANGNIPDFKSHIISLMTRVISTGEGTANNIRQFSWDTILNQGAGVEVTASDLVYWSQIGYLTMLIQFAWLAQETGNSSTYQCFKDKIWSWVQGMETHVLETMPILVIEACQEIDKTGKPSNDSSNVQLVTLPYTMSTNYGTDVVQSMYNGWDAGKDMTTALCEFVGNGVPVNQAVVGQALGYYIAAGGPQPPQGKASWGGRKFCRLLYPTGDADASFGYLIGFTYAAQTIPTPGTGTGSAAVPGSFTWKLTPSGVDDKTPDTEVNETSTVYEINMSQNGANSNNYDKWKTYVQQYGGNNNQLRITVYRTSEDLAADDKAKKYTREQVMQQGKNATTGFDRVIVGSAKITGIPGVGEVKSGEAATGISNDQLLTILDQAKSMTLFETIKGSLEMGIRVSYAVRIEVKVGNKSWQDFTNNQAEFVEYRSNPGQYVYKSNAPDGFAEIKSGYFMKSGYKEPFEAMAGTPTTEDLYFVSGGQEFVAQLTYNYTTDKSATREYEQRFSADQCDAYWGETRKEFNNATVEEIQAWIDKYTKSLYDSGEWINCSKPCEECGTVYSDGVGNESIQVTDIDPDLGDKSNVGCSRGGDDRLGIGCDECHMLLALF